MISPGTEPIMPDSGPLAAPVGLARATQDSQSLPARHYCSVLLAALGLSTAHSPATQPPFAYKQDIARDWARSGLMFLTGCGDGLPMRTGHSIPSCANGALLALRLLGADLPAAIRGVDFVTERAALNGYAAQGTISANGSCRLLKSADGWLSLNLPRPDDRDLLPAWLQLDEAPDGWEDLAKLLSGQRLAPLLERGRMLGLPVAAVADARLQRRSPWFRLHRQHQCGAPGKHRSPLVVDLSSLWAGPLCSSLLQSCGANVVRVESTRRIDGARAGNARFFDLLDAGKASVQFDFDSARGRADLLRLLHAADIVIEGSRPRALRQLGINAHELLQQRPSLLWLGISGYGRAEPEANWVAFGDDAAAASGLVAHSAISNEPLFCGDALCDPLTGLHAAVAVWALWQQGLGGLLDISLYGVGRHCAAFYHQEDPGTVRFESGQWQLEEAGSRFPLSIPGVRNPDRKASLPGADTAQVMRAC